MDVPFQGSTVTTKIPVEVNGWYRLTDGRIAFVQWYAPHEPGSMHWRATEIVRYMPSWNAAPVRG